MNKSRYSILVIGALSVFIPLLITWLIFNPSMDQANRSWAYFLPHLNGVLNAATSITLIAGFIFIKNEKVSYHKMAMIVSFILGTFFLISYVTYHSLVPSTSFGGIGWVKIVYYFFLLSHILLAIVVVPLVLLAFYHALNSDFDRHKKIVKYTFPVWLYVSITGVIVYLMISRYYTGG